MRACVYLVLLVCAIGSAGMEAHAALAAVDQVTSKCAIITNSSVNNHMKWTTS